MECNEANVILNTLILIKSIRIELIGYSEKNYSVKLLVIVTKLMFNDNKTNLKVDQKRFS